MIDLASNKQYILFNLKQKGVPQQEREDYFQECCLVYYRNPSVYKEEVGDVHIMDLLIKRVLSEEARKYKARRKYSFGKAMDISFESRVHDVPVVSKMEEFVDMTRLYSKLPSVFKTLLNTKKTTAIIAREEGVTRQAVEKQLKKDMIKATRLYRGVYA